MGCRCGACLGASTGGPTLYEAAMLGLPPATSAGQNGIHLRARPGAQAVCPLCTLWWGWALSPAPQRTSPRVSLRSCQPALLAHCRQHACIILAAPGVVGVMAVKLHRSVFYPAPPTSKDTPSSSSMPLIASPSHQSHPTMLPGNRFCWCRGRPRRPIGSPARRSAPTRRTRPGAWRPCRTSTRTCRVARPRCALVCLRLIAH